MRLKVYPSRCLKLDFKMKFWIFFPFWYFLYAHTFYSLERKQVLGGRWSESWLLRECHEHGLGVLCCSLQHRGAASSYLSWVTGKNTCLRITNFGFYAWLCSNYQNYPELVCSHSWPWSLYIQNQKVGPYSPQIYFHFRYFILGFCIVTNNAKNTEF